jgi:membrane fusion protein, multidrug efflux system
MAETAPMKSSNGQPDRALEAPLRADNGAGPAVAARPRLRKNSRRWLGISLGAIFIVGAIVVYWRWTAGGRASSGNGGAPPVMINTVTARSGDIGVYVQALGTVTPRNTVSLTARVSGQITKVEYQEGQLVHAGDPMVEIDPAPFQAAVTQAEGQLVRDQAQLANAKINLARDTDLLAKGVISQQEYDAQNATFHQFEGAVELDQGNLEAAKINLAYCHVTSPIDGLAGLRLIDPGNIVQANGINPLVVITQLKPITVEFDVAEDDVPQIVRAVHNGPKLRVDAYDRADQHKLATGTLEAFDSQINTTTGTLRLRALFKNDDQSLFPNQFVNVRLLVDTHKGVTLLPNSAIRRNDNGAFVYLLQPNQTVALQTITVETTDGNVSEVQGVQPGAVVAANNFNRLSDGANVVLRSSAGAAQAGAPHK